MASRASGKEREPVKLTEQQVAGYNDTGWVVVPHAFSPAEVAVLESAALDVMERPGPEVGREADGSPHVCWGMHLFDERLGASSSTMTCTSTSHAST